MTRKGRPTIYDYYGLEAKAYGESQWMARNQIETTEHLFFLLREQFGIRFISSIEEREKKEEEKSSSEHSPLKIKPELVLDLGCGTGYSSYVPLEKGYRVIGIDISRDMLKLSLEHQEFHKIQADMRYLPFRSNLFSLAISVSAFNFISAGARNPQEMRTFVKKAVHEIDRCMKNDTGYIAIEFYPIEEEQREILSAFKQTSFNGGLIIESSGKKKEKRYLILKRENEKSRKNNLPSSYTHSPPKKKRKKTQRKRNKKKKK